VASAIKFGTDGWRAVIADTYTFDNVRLAAQACATYFVESGAAARGIAVGFDTRFGSDRFARAVAEVLAANGVRVLLSDRFQPTPVLSYSIMDRQAGGGIIITASHNPATDNGFKVKTAIGSSAPPEMVAQIEHQIAALDSSGPAGLRTLSFEAAQAQGLIQTFDATPAYDQQIGRLVDLRALRDAGVHAVADSMYGTGQGYFKRLLSGGATRVGEIRNVVNPAFPGIAPEPIRPHIDELCRTVPTMHADIGLATDGDSDRIGLVAEEGTFINQHQVFGLLVLYLTQQRSMRGPAVRSVTMTSMADSYLERLGQKVIETPVGFKYIGAAMVANNAILGGEESGGFGFQGHLPERDAIVSGLFAIDLMVSMKRPMSGVLAYMREQFGDWHYLRVDVRYPPEERQRILDRVAAARPPDLDGSAVTSVGTMDGYKFYAEDGSWLLIRFSGTEPLLRIYTETTSPERVQRLLRLGRDIAGVG
jgi:phosphomannomutase